VSTTRPELPDETSVPPRLTTPQLVALAAGLVAGLAVWLVGLPEVTVWGTSLDAVTVPLAVIVGLGVAVAGIAATTQRRWRVVDLTVAAVLAVAGGLLLWGLNATWTPLTTPIGRVWPPLPALLNGLWLLPGVLVGLVVRRPGAALLGETLAALVEAQLGGLWGFATIYYGVAEGLGAELVLALLLYRRFGLWAAMAAGAGSAVVLSVLDLTLYYPEYPAGQKVAYAVLSVVSGAVLAGAGSWLLTRALARTGALAPLASGRVAERV
jgi:energy-coupling factor transport system substrate-specific component